MTDISQRGYVNPNVLVSTDWVAEHLNDPSVRIIESNEDPLLYPSGHIPGAVQVDWTRDLNDQLRRDYLNKQGFEALMSRIGVTPETTVVFYGDRNNWWACYAFWVFQLFGHTNARVMDGGAPSGKRRSRDDPRSAQLPSDDLHRPGTG
ncbi:rhodanese-like domain-containing protein [Oscillatoria laete-virens NRMC-F 0139]|nr:rhodanese-like domain-containing protein [Oscillatoria laete-virens]MDL5054061.1 rhodanese-like domain-containing protein [Oscillatoria laete-virens NRMC-F 0139]